VSAVNSTTLRLMTVRCQPIYVLTGPTFATTGGGR